MRRTGGSSTALLAALSCVVLSYALPQTMLVPTIGVLQRDLHVGAGAASWAVLTATLLGSAAMTPLVCQIGDRCGRRRTLIWSLAVYLASSLGAAAAPDIDALIAFRAVQGIGLALLPLSFSLIRKVMPARSAPFGLALTSGVVTGSAGLGLLAGGLIVDHLSWRWLFGVGSAVVLTALTPTVAFVPERPGRRSGRIDLPGAVLLAAGLVALLVGLTEAPSSGWTSPTVLAASAGGGVALVLFLLVERRAARPIIDPRLLIHPPLAAAHVGALALGVNQFLLYVVLPRLAELPRYVLGRPHPASYGFGATVTGAALILLPGTLITLPSSWSASLLERRGVRFPLVVGLGLAGTGAVLLAVAHSDPWQVAGLYAISSLGYGLAMASLPRQISIGAPADQGGSVNGVNTLARALGGAVGSQVAAMILSRQTAHGTGFPVSGAFTLAPVVAAAVAGAAALLVPAIGGLARRRVLPDDARLLMAAMAYLLVRGDASPELTKRLASAALACVARAPQGDRIPGDHHRISPEGARPCGSQGPHEPPPRRGRCAGPRCGGSGSARPF